MRLGPSPVGMATSVLCAFCSPGAWSSRTVMIRRRRRAMRKVGEVDRAIRDQEVAAAVFVHPGAGVEGLGRDLRRPAVRAPPHDDLPAALRRAELGPVEGGFLRPALIQE